MYNVSPSKLGELAIFETMADMKPRNCPIDFLASEKLANRSSAILLAKLANLTVLETHPI
jgi:hypothetical protein